MGAVPRGLSAEPGSQRSPDSMAERVTDAMSRRSCRSDAARIDDEDGDAHQRGSLDHQRLSLAKTLERASRLRRATKSGRARGGVVTPDTVDGPRGESMRSNAADTSTCTTTSNVGDANCRRSSSA